MGWNLAASPYDRDAGVEQGLSSIEGCYQYLFSYQNGIWMSYNPLKSNTFYNLSRKYGYWVKVNCTEVNWEVVSFPENCTNGFDDDLDDNIDCDDSDCSSHPDCITCVDNDADGYGVCPGCGTANGCTYDGDDCDDSNADVNPGATEVCDGLDNDCFGGVDNGDLCEVSDAHAVGTCISGSCSYACESGYHSCGTSGSEIVCYADGDVVHCGDDSSCTVCQADATPVCDDASTCQGYYEVATCIGGVCGTTQVDDDSGCDVSTLSKDCGYYLPVYCDGSSDQSEPLCPTSCVSDSDCDSGAHCDGTCQPDLTDGESCDENNDCISNICADGVCCATSCGGTCRSCNVAGFEGTCTNIPSGQDPDSECGGLSCNGYYWGWSIDDCYYRQDLASFEVGCSGVGSCQTASELCPTQGSGDIAITCHPDCQDPTGGTCTGTTVGSCDNINPGTHSCGIGACYREVPQCVGGVPNVCVPGVPAPTDDPDDSFIDANCDGVDGDLSDAILVSTAGVDGVSCGTLASPCKTVNYGLSRASTLGVSQLLIQAGTYNEVVTLGTAHSGMGIYGGYDNSWDRGDHTISQYRVIINGAYYATDGQYMTIRSRSAHVSFDNLRLDGPNAAGQVSGYGRSSYVVHAVNSNLDFDSITFSQGNGATGAAGSDGTDASPGSAPYGINGNNNEQYSTACDDDNGAYGGSGATNPSCWSGRGGGDGGRGGHMDSNCPFGFTATNGIDGTNADLYSGGYGQGGSGGIGASTCSDGTDGQNGNNGNNGYGGSGGSGYLIYSSYWWAGNSGSGAGIGSHGTGGGGGGGGGGCDTGTDATGAGGGGGGAGGCSAPSAGQRGNGGGGSFGIFALTSTIEVTGSTFNRGAGGYGGSGGDGGTGQLGGSGGSGGNGPGYGLGGDGGDAGDGGHSGGGGGGAGGYSYGIYRYSTSLTQSGNTFSGGSAGSGGNGGTILGGNPGTNGANGVIGNTGTFIP